MPADGSDDNRSRTWSPVAAERQPAVAALVGAALLGALAWFVGAGGLGGRLVPYMDGQSGGTGFRVDINNASRAELMQLPGVGPSLADRILERRASRGPFRSLEEILDVPGIGATTLGRLEPYLLRPEDR
jgi:competence protein ComEA